MPSVSKGCDQNLWHDLLDPQPTLPRLVVVPHNVSDSVNAHVCAWSNYQSSLEVQSRHPCERYCGLRIKILQIVALSTGWNTYIIRSIAQVPAVQTNQESIREPMKSPAVWNSYVTLRIIPVIWETHGGLEFRWVAFHLNCSSHSVVKIPTPIVALILSWNFHEIPTPMEIQIWRSKYGDPHPTNLASSIAVDLTSPHKV